MRSAIIDLGASDRGPSTKLWSPITAGLADDPRRGVYLFDDYFDLLTGAHTATQASAGTFALDSTVGNIGVALADCNSTTDHQGINVQRNGWLVSPAAGRTICFEGRLKAADTATGPEFFFGLSITDTTLIASGANHSTDHIGFESVSDDLVLLFHTEDGGTRVSGATSPATMVDDTYIKLGFRINPDLTVDVFVNGEKKDVAFSAAPDICVASIIMPSLVCQTAGTTDPIVHLDWMALGTYA